MALYQATAERAAKTPVRRVTEELGLWIKDDAILEGVLVAICRGRTLLGSRCIKAGMEREGENGLTEEWEVVSLRRI